MSSEKKYMIRISPRGPECNFPFCCGGNQANIDWLRMQVGKDFVATRHGPNHYKFVENGYTIHIYDACVAKEIVCSENCVILSTQTKENTTMNPVETFPTSKRFYVYRTSAKSPCFSKTYIETNIGDEVPQRFDFGTVEAAEKWIANLNVRQIPFVYYGIETV